MRIEQQVDELSRFADLDCEIITGTNDHGETISFRQRGIDVRITFLKSGQVLERRDSADVLHNSYFGLLAAPDFSNLRLLARNQLAMLQRNSVTLGKGSNIDIPVTGTLYPSALPSKESPILDQLDDWTADASRSCDVSALVIDGPAGIGKTHLIRALVERRATRLGPGSRPLVLHIQSRGRQLTTLPDLLAGTLQSMRLSLTYEQIPVLARHGLVQLAIDGFDELADPNGYDTAWGSLRDLLSDIRGNGVVVLAGRDTFIDADTVRRALPILSTEAIASIHLRPPTPAEAVKWLQQTDLDTAKITSLLSTGIFEEGGYALRPFFLGQIRSLADSNTGMTLLTSFPLGTLVQEMILRELTPMKGLGLGISDANLVELLNQLFEEIAREMADSESDSIDVASLQLIADIVFGPHVIDEALRALRNRVKSIALLEADIVPDRRRFIHSEVHGYFVSRAYIKLLASDQIEVSRSMRRSIFGTELLEIFHDVSRESPSTQLEAFRSNALTILKGRRHDDRSPGNIAALLLASLDSSQDAASSVAIEDVSLDDCLMRGSVGPVTLRRTAISKLDVRTADASCVAFEDSTVISLVADAATRLPPTCPMPNTLTIEEGGGLRSLFVPSEIEAWLIAKGAMGAKGDDHPAHSLTTSPARRLLDKICRTIMRQSWIRDINDDRAGRLLRDPNWQRLRESLLKFGLLEERKDVQAGGQNSVFVRVKRPRDILEANGNDPAITSLLDELSQ